MAFYQRLIINRQSTISNGFNLYLYQVNMGWPGHPDLGDGVHVNITTHNTTLSEWLLAH